jgi:parallel beta-helix repeat protein
MIKPATRLSLLSIVVAIVAIAAVAAEETLSPWLLKVIPVSLQAWIVCPEGPPSCQFSKIQEAIDGVPEGTTIEIKAGIYEENLLIRKSVTLEAIQGEQVILKSAQENSPAMLLVSSRPIDVRVTGLTILPARSLQGNGIELMGAVKAVLERNIIQYHRWGILVLGKPEWLLSEELPVYIRENTMQNNRTPVVIGQSSGVTISKNTIRDNKFQSQQDTGGILISDSRKVVVSDNLIQGSDWYGLYIYRSRWIQVNGNSIENNPYGILVVGSQQVDILANEIQRNGWGVEVHGEPYEETSVAIQNNRITQQEGYGLAVERLYHVSVCWQNEIRENQQGDYLVQDPLFSLQPRRDPAAEEELRKQCEEGKEISSP